MNQLRQCGTTAVCALKEWQQVDTDELRDTFDTSLYTFIGFWITLPTVEGHSATNDFESTKLMGVRAVDNICLFYRKAQRNDRKQHSVLSPTMQLLQDYILHHIVYDTNKRCAFALEMEFHQFRFTALNIEFGKVIHEILQS